MKFNVWKGSQKEWDKHLASSNNDNIYQCFSWGEYSKKSNWQIFRLVEINKKRSGLRISVLLKKYPFGLGVVWCQGLSIFSTNINKDELQKAIKKVLKINILYLRIRFINEFNKTNLDSINRQGWEKSVSQLSNNETLIYNFKQSNVQSKNWRKNLKRFNSSENQLVHWKNPDAEIIFDLYKEMEAYKKIRGQFTKNDIKSLIEKFKSNLVVVICKNKMNKIISLRAAIILNQNALDIFSISTYEGRKKYAGYGTFSKLLELCKKNKVIFYDLGGIDKINNLSVYNFKKGIGAKEFKFLGEFDWCNIRIFRLIFSLLIRILYKKNEQ